MAAGTKAASNAVQSLELAFLAGIPDRRYTSFRDYPMKDNMRLTVAVAATIMASQ